MVQTLDRMCLREGRFVVARRVNCMIAAPSDEHDLRSLSIEGRRLALRRPHGASLRWGFPQHEVVAVLRELEIVGRVLEQKRLDVVTEVNVIAMAFELVYAGRDRACRRLKPLSPGLRDVLLRFELAAEHALERADAFDSRPESLARPRRHPLLADPHPAMRAVLRRQDREQALNAAHDLAGIRRLDARRPEEPEIAPLEHAHPPIMRLVWPIGELPYRPVAVYATCGMCCAACSISERMMSALVGLITWRSKPASRASLASRACSQPVIAARKSGCSWVERIRR